MLTQPQMNDWDFSAIGRLVSKARVFDKPGRQGSGRTGSIAERDGSGGTVPGSAVVYFLATKDLARAAESFFNFLGHLSPRAMLNCRT
jgi:hypothetical protein